MTTIRPKATEAENCFSCTAFETTNPSKSGKTIECLLFGHANVQAATGVEGTCFKMAAVKKASAKAAAATAGLAGLANTINLGEGMCRGYNWADDDTHWPKDKGHRTPKECLAACKQTTGCTAFDLSQPSGKKAQCYLYGHSDVQQPRRRRPASISHRTRSESVTPPSPENSSTDLAAAPDGNPEFGRWRPV